MSNDNIEILFKWLDERNEEFKEGIPSKDYYSQIPKLLHRLYGVHLTKYLGAGDNGIVFLVSDGDVIKLTIDKNEAYLWHRILNKKVNGLVGVKDVRYVMWSGESHLFIVKAEYAPYDLNTVQRSMVSNALKSARSAAANRIGPHVTKRTASLIEAFYDVSKVDESFKLIPSMIRELSLSYGGHVYDLRPDNFKINEEGHVVLIDPSVPDLMGDYSSPKHVMLDLKENIDWMLKLKMHRLTHL